MSSLARVLGVVFFFGVLYAVDVALARWGSPAIRRRPRPGLRVTVLFVTVVAIYTALGLLAQWTAARSVPVAWILLALAFPACAASAIAVDLLLPQPAE